MAVAPAPPAAADLPAPAPRRMAGPVQGRGGRGADRGSAGLPFIGLETYDFGGGALGVRTHFDRLGLVVAAMFAGRFAVQLFRQRRYPGVPRERTATGAGRGAGAAAAPSRSR